MQCCKNSLPAACRKTFNNVKHEWRWHTDGLYCWFRSVIYNIIDHGSADWAASLARVRIGCSCSSNEGALASLIMSQSKSTPLSNPHSDSASSTPERQINAGNPMPCETHKHTGKHTGNSHLQWSSTPSVHVFFLNFEPWCLKSVQESWTRTTGGLIAGAHRSPPDQSESIEHWHLTNRGIPHLGWWQWDKRIKVETEMCKVWFMLSVERDMQHRSQHVS